MTTKQLLFLLSAAYFPFSAIHGYQVPSPLPYQPIGIGMTKSLSSALSSSPSGMTWTTPDIASNSQTNDPTWQRNKQEKDSTRGGVSDVQSRRKKVSYDVGLGKNKAIVPNSATLRNVKHSSKTDPHLNSATQYLIEYETTRPFPSPIVAAANSRTKLDASFATGRKQVEQNKQPSRQLPKIHLNRFWGDDVLTISNTTPQTSSLSSSSSTSAVRGFGMGQTRQWDINTPWVEMLIHEQQQLHQQQQQQQKQPQFCPCPV